MSKNEEMVMTQHVYRPGDLIFTQSPSCLGRTIRVCTLADVLAWWFGIPTFDHVGVVSHADDDGNVFVCEALIEENCVVVDRLDHRLRLYRKLGCRIWHSPLAKPLDGLEAAILKRWLLGQIDKPYDRWGGWGARSLAFGWLAHWLPSRETLGNWFCSELAAAALREMGRFETTNVSEWSPAWLGWALLERDACVGAFEIERRKR